jgi:imidazolonepropionase
MSGTLIRSATIGSGAEARRADVRCRGGVIAEIGPGLPDDGDEPFDARGRCVLPGFVDCHTHACWAGSRLGEWRQRLAGASYLDILAAGGGIMSTVRAVRAASDHELADRLLDRLDLCLRHGTTTIEVKSGYGLNTADELKMLRAIATAAARWPGTVVLTACLGHAKDPDETDPVGRTIAETLPAVTAEFPGIAVDAYCERGAWSVAECLRLFDAALTTGHPVRIHADQFNDLGMIPEAVRRGFLSVDHLEASASEHLDHLARSETFGVMLPASSFHLGGIDANGRAFLDAGGRLAIATNFNPGSAPTPSVPMAMALAVRRLGLRPEEALRAATRTPAELLGLPDRGVLEVGRRADMLLLSCDDPAEVCHTFGANLVEAVWLAGERVIPG